jgi:hypothetical protein
MAKIKWITTSNATPVTIGAPITGDGCDVSLIAGKGTKGYKDGSINFKDGDGNNLISLHSDKTITILGEDFCLETIKKALCEFKSDTCKCTMNQLLTNGCNCGGK